MKLNTNLIFSKNAESTIVKDPRSGNVVRMTEEGILLLRTLNDSNFDIPKTVKKLAGMWERPVSEKAIEDFLYQATRLHLVESKYHSDTTPWRGRFCRIVKLCNPERHFRFIFQCVSKKRCLIHPLLSLLTVFLLLPTMYILLDFKPAINGHILFFAFFFILIWPVHEIGHWVLCKYFGGSVPSCGIGVMFWAIPYLWSDVGDIWLFKNRRHRILVLLGGIWFEFLMTGSVITILLFTKIYEYISPALLALNVRILFDSLPGVSDIDLIRRELSRKKGVILGHFAVWLLGASGFLLWVGVR